MLLKKEFYTMCDNMGLEDHELDLADIIWCKAEKSMLGVKEKQVASLLATKEKKPKTKTKSLTQADVQRMINLNKSVLKLIQSYISEYNGVKAELYDKCDPDDPSTEEAFIEYKKLSSFLKTLKEKKSNFSNIQAKLKQIRKEY